MTLQQWEEVMINIIIATDKRMQIPSCDCNLASYANVWAENLGTILKLAADNSKFYVFT
jgi:hypothetical protein